VKHWLYLPPPLVAGVERVLDADRAHYLARVLRLPRGAVLVCFDGLGSACQATLSRVEGKTVILQIDATLECRPAPGRRLHLVQGLLKGAAMEQVIQKATELGATDLWLVAADRSNVTLSADRFDRKQAHWQRIVESAAAQCRQLHLPRLHGPLDLASCLSALAGTTLILLDPGGPTLPQTLPAEDLALLVGPEGGWSDLERTLAQSSGACRYGLGALILRAETAPLAMLAVARHSTGWA
jgi:16S rRNA (uracil1498-N3)-methyltransferase